MNGPDENATQATGQSWANIGAYYWHDIRQVTPFIGMPVIGQGIIDQYQAYKVSILKKSSVKGNCNNDIRNTYIIISIKIYYF
jgi:hypothetical protein